MIHVSGLVRLGNLVHVFTLVWIGWMIHSNALRLFFLLIHTFGLRLVSRLDLRQHLEKVLIEGSNWFRAAAKSVGSFGIC